MSIIRQFRLTGDRQRGMAPRFAAAVALVAGSALVLAAGQTATAGIVPTVPLATAAGYSVLGGQSVTNTNSSVLGQSVGVSPGTSIVGFPPGEVLAPGTIEVNTAASSQAQSDLTIAYDNAAGRSVEFTQTNPDLVGQTLLPGVYAATAKAPLALSGELVLDGQGDPDAVFIFQTDSTLITSSASTITLIDGASECNVFWQVGSSATLGSGSFFVGTILALTSITVESNVVVHGRALARNGAVTLDDDDFTEPSCVPAAAPTTTTTTTPTTTATTATTTPVTTTPVTTTPVTTTPVTTGPAPVTTFTPIDVTLPATGPGSLVTQSGVGVVVMLSGLAALVVARRRQPA